MKTNAPKTATWLISVIAGTLGILTHLGHVSALAGYSFWLLAGGFVLLALATTLKDL